MDANALGRWTRFAAKGGIGRCTALTDCVAEKPEDLMFLTGDEIVVLMQIPEAEDMYLGYCEGVVGRFSGAHVRFHSKLKKPVMTKRSSSTNVTGTKSPTPSVSGSLKSPSPRSPSFGHIPMPAELYGTRSPGMGMVSPPPTARRLDFEEIHDPHFHSPSPASSSRFSSPRSSLQRPLDSFTQSHHPTHPPPQSPQHTFNNQPTQPLKFAKSSPSSSAPKHTVSPLITSTSLRELDRSPSPPPTAIPKPTPSSSSLQSQLPSPPESAPASAAVVAPARRSSLFTHNQQQSRDLQSPPLPHPSQSPPLYHPSQSPPLHHPSQSPPLHHSSQSPPPFHSSQSPPPLSSSSLSQREPSGSRLGHSATSSFDHSSSLGHDLAASSIGHSDSSHSTASTVTNAPIQHPDSDAIEEKLGGPGVRGGEYGEKGRDMGHEHGNGHESPTSVLRHDLGPNAHTRGGSTSSYNSYSHHHLPPSHPVDDDPYTPHSTSFSTHHTRVQSNDGSHSSYPDSDSGSLLYGSRASSVASTSSHTNLDRTESHRSRRGRPTSDEADGETGIGMALLAGMLGGDDDDDEGSEEGDERRDLLPDGLTRVESVNAPPRKDSLRRYQASASDTEPPFTTLPPPSITSSPPTSTNQPSATSPESPNDSRHSLTNSLRPSEVSSDGWDGGDIYDDYRYSRYSTYSGFHQGKRASQFTVSSAMTPDERVPPMPRGRTDSGRSDFLSPVSPRSPPMFGNGAGYFDLGRPEKGKEVGVEEYRRGSVDSDASVYTRNSPELALVPESSSSQQVQEPTTRVSPTAGKPPPSKPAPLDLSIPHSQARRRPHDPTSTHSAQSLFSSHSANSIASPLLHTTWASPEASPEPEYASGFGSASGSRHYYSGVSDDSGEKRRTRERDSDQGYLGRNIVVEDDSDGIPVIQPQPPSPSSLSSPSSPYSPTSTHNPGAAPALSNYQPPPSPLKPGHPPTQQSSIPNPFARPTLSELRGEPEPGSGMRQSLFLPHPNAPKAPPSSAGPMYIRDHPMPPDHQPPPAGPFTSPPRARGGWAPDFMRGVVQQDHHRGGGGGGGGTTFYATADLSQSMGPVPIFFSLEPPQSVPAIMGAAAQAAAEHETARAQAMGQAGAGQQGGGQQSTGGMGTMQGPGSPQTRTFPAPIMSTPPSSVQQHSQPESPFEVAGRPPHAPVPRKAATVPFLGSPGSDTPEASASAVGPSSPIKVPSRKTSLSPELLKSGVSRAGSGSGSGTLQRPDFTPQVGGARPRSRSFSGFERPGTEAKLPMRSASPSSKPTITQSATLDQPSTAVPIRPADPPRGKGRPRRGSQSPARGPSPLSLPQNTVFGASGSSSPARSSSSPLSREPPITAASSSTQSLANPTRPHPLRHVTSVGVIPSSAHSVTSPPTSPLSPTSPTQSSTSLSAPKPRVLRKAPSMAADMASGRPSSSQPTPRISGPSTEQERQPALPKHMSKNSIQGPTISPRASIESLGRRSVTSPTPTSLRSKLSMPNLRRPSVGARSASMDEHSPLSPTYSEQHETVQVDDMDFELVMPSIPASLRQSEESISRPRGSPDVNSLSTGGGGSSLHLRTDSPALSMNPPRSPTVASARASDSDSVTVEAHRQREQRWITLMGASPASQARKNKKVKKLVVEGVPASVRSLVWAYLTDCKSKGVPGVFEQMTARGKESTKLAHVDQDVKRVVEERSVLGGVETSMSMVLKAYLTMAPDVRYDTGLTLIVGHLLLVIPEENTFWVFISIMDSLLRPYFSNITTQLEVDSELFGRALDVNDPQLAKKLLVDLGISTVSICRPWFSSLFTSALPVDILSRCWDMFLYDGQPYLIRMGLAIAYCCRTKILNESNTNVEATLDYLHRPQPNWLPPSTEGFATMAASFKLKDEDVAKQRVKMEQQVKKQQAQAAKAAASSRLRG